MTESFSRYVYKCASVCVVPTLIINKIRKNVKRKDFDDDEDFVIAKHEPLHFWVLVDETIHVDITADQFSPECNECFKKIWIWRNEDSRHIFNNFFYE